MKPYTSLLYLKIRQPCRRAGLWSLVGRQVGVQVPTAGYLACAATLRFRLYNQAKTVAGSFKGLTVDSYYHHQ